MNVLPPAEVCAKARLAKDPRFDGRFFIAVVTTGIYCRPVCPVRAPAEANVRYFATAAAAQTAGFRPCLRCRPETARRLPEWTIASDTVLRGLRAIDAGFLNTAAVSDLAADLGVGERQLNRLFHAEVGATPSNLAAAHRVQVAKRLISDTVLPMTQVAEHAGYGSQRRFNDEIKRAFGMPPRQLRNARRGSPPKQLQLRLPVREPYDFEWVFAFLDKRAMQGIESIEGMSYRRRVPLAGGEQGWVRVDKAVNGDSPVLQVTIPQGVLEPVAQILRRVRRVFDLDADGEVIHAHLRDAPVIGQWVQQRPGLRVPGAWDGFETTVRGILGQQVSVARATVLADIMVQRYGDGYFPTPQALALAEVAEIGMPGQRGRAISALAAAVADGALRLDECANPESFHEQLCAIPGIGPWTASYTALRIARDPDAFPESDWVVMKVLDAKPAGCRAIAEAWRPWRAYGAMYLWFGAAAGG